MHNRVLSGIFWAVLMLPVMTCAAQTIEGPFNLLWDHAGDDRLVGFTIYLSPGQPVDVPDPTARSAYFDLAPDTYQIYMTAYGADGLVSVPSETISVTVTGAILPLAPPTGVRIGTQDPLPTTLDVTLHTTETPAIEGNDGYPWDLGFTFSPLTDGEIVGCAHYQTLNDQHQHTCRIWDETGVLLTTAAFTQGSPDNWNEIMLTTPIPVLAGEIYTLSVDAQNLWPGTKGYAPPDTEYLSFLNHNNTKVIGEFPQPATWGDYFRDVIFRVTTP